MYKLRSDLGTAPPYEVTCLEEDQAVEESHRHVVAVETRDPDGGQTRWSTLEVITALRGGELFVVSDGKADRAAALEPSICPACATATISVSPGGAEIAPCA